MRALRRAWFELTDREQEAVTVVLALALLGIGVKLWLAAGSGGAERGVEQRTMLERAEPVQRGR